MKQINEPVSWREKNRGKNTQKEQENKNRLRRNEEVLRELQENMKGNNIHIMGIPELEEEQGIENLFEKVMMGNIPNLMREKFTQIQETEIPNQEEPKEAHFKTHPN